MRNYILGLITGAFIWAGATVYALSPIDTVAQYFGPRLLAAVACVTLDQINVLRVKAALPTLTTNQMMQAISAKYPTIPPCQWETNSVGR